jgi:16S rRNA (cytosine967-C5)-methyltransferase
MKHSADLAPALAEAARAVAGVAAGRSLAQAMERRAEGAAGGALADLCYGTLRRYGWVQALVRALSHKGAVDARLEALLWCALYALDSGRYSDYTVVDQAVRASALLELGPARGYVNGLLRSYLRQREALAQRIASDPQALHQHPLWWIEALERAYPDNWR